MIENAALVFMGSDPIAMLKRYVKARKALGKWHEEKRFMHGA
jgi:hypothetical protein